MFQDIPPPTWIDTPEKMLRVVRHIRDTKECAMDTETTGLSRHKDHVVIWSACPDLNTRYCLSREMLEIYDMELARDPNISWYFTNQTFDFCMLNSSGVLVPQGRTFCTLAMDWLHNENRQGMHGLKETAADYCDMNMRDFKELFTKQRGETLPDAFARTLRENFPAAVAYASYDAYATFRVYKALRKRLKGQFNNAGVCLWDYFKEIEMPFTRVLYDMIRRGIKIDTEYLADLSPQMTDAADALRRKVAKIAGKEINLNSPKQLQWFLYDKLGLKPIKMTKGGESGNVVPSTDKEVLTAYAEQGVEACGYLNELRKITKIQGTYVDGLPKWADRNGRIHSVFSQHVTVTGRLSSTDPNLMNIPRSEGDVFGLRKAFIPKEGHTFCVFDYKQLEIRILAHMAQEQNMIDVINKGWDVHTGTASLMFGHDYEDIVAAAKKKKSCPTELSELEKEMIFARQASKTIGFGRPWC